MLVEQRDGRELPADAIVVARSVAPQRGPTKDFLAGLYRGLARANVLAVGVQLAGLEEASVPASRGTGSTVDSIDTGVGRLALVLLLAGAAPGHYGVEDTPPTASCLRSQSVATG